MNTKKLAKYFPEVAHLPPHQQQSLLSKAYADAIARENKTRHWNNTLVTVLLLTTLCFLIVLLVRQMLNMSPVTSAILLLLLAFPSYLLVQQQRMIRQIRISLQKFLP
ncbi:hypothetical protein [Cellvibrio mixtus]|uniref:hypothetical protein n=1 Tax=Cellvibrio mixtus TaxID=39650 RepID=UPI0005874913|nr:hypothetical protein [Cellvibrio mixtus]